MEICELARITILYWFFFLQEVSLGVLDSSDQSGILSAFECIMSHIYQPCLTALETWGELDSDPNGRKIRSTFMDSYKNFLYFLGRKLLSDNLTFGDQNVK